MGRKTSLIVSYILHPLVIFPFFLLFFMDWTDISNSKISFWLVTVFLVAVVPYMIAKKMAEKLDKPVHELNSVENKRKILMPSFLFFSLAFLYFVFAITNDAKLFRIPIGLMLEFYLSLYFTMAFVLIVYTFNLNLSLHVILWGCVFGFFYFSIYNFYYIQFLPHLFVTLLIVLFVGIARFTLDAHKRWELYFSFFLGMVFTFEVHYLIKFML